MNPKAKLTLIAYGNPSRGDDGAAPLLLRRLQHSLKPGHSAVNITFIEDLQLNPEHVVDIEHADAVIFIDAERSSETGFAFQPLAPKHNNNFTSHVQSPENILYLLGTIQGSVPAAYLLAIRGAQFALAAPMSKPTRQAVAQAQTFVEELVRTPLARWQTYTSECHA